MAAATCGAECGDGVDANTRAKDYQERADVNYVQVQLTNRPSIFDLPNELLERIFRNLLDEWMPEESYSVWPKSNVEQIRSLRLVCRRFCLACSHLLMRDVWVSPSDPESLDRLRKVSRHPAISKGIRFVRVVLEFYDANMAKRPHNFQEHVATVVASRLQVLEKMTVPNSSTEEMNMALQQGWVFYDFLSGATPFGGDTVPSNKNLTHQQRRLLLMTKLLNDAHRRYQRCYADQERILKHGEFAMTVAEAMAMMPRARCLDFRDSNLSNTIRETIFPPDVLMQNEFANGGLSQLGIVLGQLVGPQKMSDADEYYFMQPPIRMTLEVFDAIYRHELDLEAIIFDFGWPLNGTAYATSATDEEQKGLRAITKRLQYFRFRNQHTVAETGAYSHSNRLHFIQTLLATLTGSKSLRGLSVKGISELLARHDPELYCISTFLPLAQKPDLLYMSLSNAPIKFSYLRRLAACIPLDALRCQSYSFDTLHLLDGSWRDALNILRPCLEGKVATIVDVKGGRIDELSEQDRNRVFGYKDANYELNEAELFLVGLSDTNPLRASQAADEEEANVALDT